MEQLWSIVLALYALCVVVLSGIVFFKDVARQRTCFLWSAGLGWASFVLSLRVVESMPMGSVIIGAGALFISVYAYKLWNRV